MKLKELNKFIEYPNLVNQKIVKYEKERIIRKQAPDENEIKGHIEKSEHNLKFIQDNLKIGYFDWCITGRYYAVYHATLALIIAKGYISKNHDATLCILIREYYKHGINEEDIGLINKFFLDYQDLLFYVQSKNKREEATYSSYYKFDKKTVEELRLKAILFINKVKGILKIKK
jgi:uncharacterized protein (UPF0332 family)